MIVLNLIKADMLWHMEDVIIKFYYFLIKILDARSINITLWELARENNKHNHNRVKKKMWFRRLVQIV